MPVGGISKAHDHDKNVALLIEHIQKLENGDWEVVEVLETHQQVVAGIKYYFTGKFKNRTEKHVVSGKIWLWHRPWDNYYELGFEERNKLE